MSIFFIGLIMLFSTSLNCANPLNKITTQSYKDDASQEECKKQLINQYKEILHLQNEIKKIKNYLSKPHVMLREADKANELIEEKNFLLCKAIENSATTYEEINPSLSSLVFTHEHSTLDVEVNVLKENIQLFQYRISCLDKNIETINDELKSDNYHTTYLQIIPEITNILLENPFYSHSKVLNKNLEQCKCLKKEFNKKIEQYKLLNNKYTVWIDTQWYNLSDDCDSYGFFYPTAE